MRKCTLQLSYYLGVSLTKATFYVYFYSSTLMNVCFSSEVNYSSKCHVMTVFSHARPFLAFMTWKKLSSNTFSIWPTDWTCYQEVLLQKRNLQKMLSINLDVTCTFYHYTLPQQQLSFFLGWKLQFFDSFFLLTLALALSLTSPVQNISLRGTSAMLCCLLSAGSRQKVSLSHSSSTGFHSSSIHWWYHLNSQSQTSGLPRTSWACAFLIEFVCIYSTHCEYRYAEVYQGQAPSARSEAL